MLKTDVACPLMQKQQNVVANAKEAHIKLVVTKMM